jgi:hypothetical protein
LPHADDVECAFVAASVVAKLAGAQLTINQALVGLRLAGEIAMAIAQANAADAEGRAS